MWRLLLPASRTAAAEDAEEARLPRRAGGRGGPLGNDKRSMSCTLGEDGIQMKAQYSAALTDGTDPKSTLSGAPSQPSACLENVHNSVKPLLSEREVGFCFQTAVPYGPRGAEESHCSPPPPTPAHSVLKARCPRLFDSFIDSSWTSRDIDAHGFSLPKTHSSLPSHCVSE